MGDDYQIEMLWRCTSCRAKNRGRDMACGACGSPKDGSEEYEMPSDTSRAAAVEDEALLRVAKGGANWRCAYCGSDARNAQGECARCGAERTREEQRARAAARGAPPRAGRGPWIALVLVGLLFCFVLALRTKRRAPPDSRAPETQQAVAAPEFVDVEGEVVARNWTRTVAVERWQLWPFEGFAESKPEGAVEVKDIGMRVHHHEQVLDGYDTQTYSETVPDGFDTQSYTTSEACGQTCTPKPQICNNVCTPNKNGFATCKNVCTGGGTSCTTKYCTVTKTKQVPRTKTVTKTKQVPRYRSEPRNATWYAWKALAWKTVRTIPHAGTEEPPTWPTDAEVALGKDERKIASERFVVALAYVTPGGARNEATYVAASEASFAAMPLKSKHTVRIRRYGSVEVIPITD